MVMDPGHDGADDLVMRLGFTTDDMEGAWATLFRAVEGVCLWEAPVLPPLPPPPVGPLGGGWGLVWVPHLWVAYRPPEPWVAGGAWWWRQVRRRVWVVLREWNRIILLRVQLRLLAYPSPPPPGRAPRLPPPPPPPPPPDADA